MSSVKVGVRVCPEVCADCGSLDPGWAILNRGLLVCDECCSVHRSLGRHISQVRSLKKAYWPATLLKMVQTLNAGGVNSLWEHALCDSKIIRRKPQPKDPLHPTKADFIRAKHQSLFFILRSSDGEEDLNQQLHSSVRTSNLETSLRLLAQGADPNYFHQEKGNMPLHVAARAGQMSQVELLIVYGADPGALDKQGNTPASCARISGHREMSQRLTECLYEVPDRFTYFLCRRRPDHNNNQHFLVPDLSDCIEVPHFTKDAKMKLQQLPNPLFEDLAMDVYDEVDRRETEAIWQSSPASLEHCPVPFLPVNPELSAMRNQGRQKLARFSPREFASLVIDILHDCKRRQSPSIDVMKSNSKSLDDEPLYDSVASDEDYATAEQIAALVAANAIGSKLPSTITQSSSPQQPSTLPTAENSVTALPPSPQKLPLKTCSVVEDDLRNKLAASQFQISQLSAEIERLQTKIEKITQENKELRSAVNCHSSETETEPVLDVRTVPIRPVSMYETRESVRNQVSTVGSMPQSEEVVKRTDQVTKRIQELWSTMQSPDSRHGFVPCAERIRVAVAELTAIFPQKPADEVVRLALRQLNTTTVRLQAECANLEGSSERVRTCAYNMAKATRQLLTRFQESRHSTRT
ncbi:ARF GTPase-activating protein GIT1 [Lycorma delicatula]|uniref:ARF GTPase-activating protein GIT1 n=1 Tax=Lycorma delicatula TaxID=130591 RepID=UPI003F5194B3